MAAREFTVTKPKTAPKRVTKASMRQTRTSGPRLRGYYSDTRGTGPEPTWDDVEKLSSEQLRKRWNDGAYFYYYHHTIKDARPFIVEVLGKQWTKDEQKAFARVKDWMIGSQLGPMCIMIHKGARWPEGMKEKAQGYLNEAFLKSKLASGGEVEYVASGEVDEDGEPILKEVVVETKEEPVARPVTIRDRILDIRNDIIGGLEEMEDTITKQSKTLPTNSIMAYLRNNNCPQQIVPYMEELFQGRLDFMKEVREGKDAQLKEAYASYSKKNIDLWIQWYTMVVADLADFKRAKLATRKVRVRKPPTADKLVRKLKFLKEFPELGLTSIKATEVVHATQLWVYNVKTRKLGVYIASDLDKELTVKGSTILGWDPKTSVAKTLRKPAEQLKEFQAAGKVQLRTFLSKIKATEIKLNGRISEQVILLKASK